MQAFLRKGEGHGGAATTNDAKFIINEQGYYEIRNFGNRDAKQPVMNQKRMRNNQGGYNYSQESLNKHGSADPNS